MKNPAVAELWSESLTAFEQYHHLLSRLLTDYRAELLPWLEKVLLNRRDIPLALVIVDKLSTDEKKQLFPSLVQLASKTVPHVGTVRNIISGLPRDWVLLNVEGATNGILKQADAETCRRILELYFELNRSLGRRLAERARKSSNEETRDLGAEFLEKFAD
jgi:hypothetical protein